jgi:2'-5' RNA ligase
MRAFLGIPIAQDLVSKVVNIQKKFSDFDIKMVEKDNFHFNLKFFRHIEEQKLGKIKEIVANVCEKFEKFDINMSGLGTFPSKTYIKVIWLGVKDGYNTMVSLSDMINQGLETEFEKEKGFTPHLTIGRIRSGKNKEKLVKIRQELENIEIGTMNVDRIVLFESKLSPQGPVYKEVFSVKL